MHPFARKAAAAALAAHRQKKFREYHHKLFQNFSSINDAKIQQIAREIGLDMKKFNKDLNDPAIQSIISRDLAEGGRAEVRGTPSMFVNGKALSNRGPDGFKQMIEAEVRKGK